MSSTFALVLLCWAFPFRQLGVVGLLAPALKSKSWFPAQMLNGQQVSCSSCREGKRCCFRKDSEMQAEKSFRKSKKEKEEKSYQDRVWRQWKDDARARSCLFSRGQAESQGSDWPVLLTCPGSRDASPALEGDKVCEMQCGEGIGLGCAVLECDFNLERIPLCHRENSGDTEAGAGGCRKHWAQLVLALHSSVPSVPTGGQLRALGRAGKDQRSMNVCFAEVLMCQGRKQGLGRSSFPSPQPDFPLDHLRCRHPSVCFLQLWQALPLPW